MGEYRQSTYACRDGLEPHPTVGEPIVADAGAGALYIFVSSGDRTIERKLK